MCALIPEDLNYELSRRAFTRPLLYDCLLKLPTKTKTLRFDDAVCPMNLDRNAKIDYKKVFKNFLRFIFNLILKFKESFFFT